MKKYENYKNSKLKWFEKVPEHWEEGKICYYFQIGRGRVISELELNPDGQFPVYSSQTKNDGCLGFIDTYDFDASMLTWTTDGANAGSVFLRSGKFNCTNVCGTLLPKIEVSLKYYLYYLQHVTQFYKRPDTNGAKIMNNEMSRIHCLIPSLSEQIQIAGFLDNQTSIIDDLITQKEKLVDLLKEKRQAIISEAITKGLNPGAKMKNSGIKWLGWIPEDWDTVALRYLNNKIGSGVTPKGGADVYVEDGILFIRSQNVHFDGLRLDDVVKIDLKTHEKMSGTSVKINDVLLNITGASIGRCCVVKVDSEMNVNQHVCIIRTKDKLNPEFLNLVLQSNIGQTQISLLITGGNREGLTFEAIKDFIVPVPNVSTQTQIVTTINEFINKEIVTTNIINNQITKLKDYRQSLISEAVTGKIDVRGWHPNQSYSA